MSSKVVRIDVAAILPNPYGRYIKDDPNRSAEAFRKNTLVPKLQGSSMLEVDMSGSNRFTSSFLEEAFGGLVRHEGFTQAELEKKMIVKHKLLPSIVDEIWFYIERMENSKGN